VGFFVALFQHSRKRGFKGFFEVVVVFVLLAVLAGMMLPALSKAKAKAQRINSANNLKQIGVAARLFASDNNDRLPDSLDEMLPELGTPKVMLDPETGQRYTYLGAGKTESMPNAILAYSPERATGTREVLFADGSVLSLSAARFAEALAKDRAAAAPPPPTAPATAPVAQPAPGAQPGAQEKPPTVAAVATQAPVAAATTGTTASAPAPTASGIKSLKFDLPKAGRPYTFTRVLSLSNEPPTISFRLMSGRLFVFVRAALQLTAFLFGLALAAYQWRRAEPRSFRLAVGLALAALGTVDVLIAWRALGLGLIVGTPGLALVAVAWCIWRWRRRRPRPASKPPGGQALGVASAVVSLAVLWLWTQANDVRAAALPAPPLSIVSATYTGTASERAAQLEATLTFLASVTNQSAGLFGREVAVQEFVATSGEAILWRDGDRVGVRLPAPGSAAVRLRLLVKLSGEASQRQLDFGVPPALGSRLTLTVKEPEAEVEFPGAVSLRRQAKGEATVVEAVLGATNRVVLTWTPKRKRAADVATTVFAQQTALVTLGEGVMNTHAIMEWQVTQGELSVVRVRLPRSHRLLKVSGEHLRSWDFSETNREVLNLELVKPMAPMVRLVLDTEKPLENLPASLAVPLPEALEVKRQTGAVAVRGTEELSLSLRRAEGLERIDQAEFARTAGEVPSGVFGAWRFIRPDFDLQVQADVALPRLEAVVRQQFSVGLEQLSLVTHVDYTISRVGVFVLRLAVPPAWRVEAVQCDAMQTWSEQEETNRRWLEVRLEQRTLGPVSVLVRLRQSYTNLAPALDLAGLHPRDAEKLTGYVTVAAEAGVGLKTSALEGITEVPAAAVPGVAAGAAGLLAFKYVSTEPQAEAPWRLALATERLEPWLRAETATFVTVGETIVTGRTLVRYEIQNAPVREFRLRVPGAWRNVELAGAGVRRRDHTNGVWRVELQNKVAGEYRLTLHWELPRTNAATLTLAGAEALGVERETGVIGLLMQSQLQLETDTAAGQLLRIDARELPEWAASQSGGTPALSFRYLRPGWQLPLQVRRFENAAVLQALADQVRLRTVLADDGQQMTQLELSVRNNGRQNLALTLPPDAQLWSAFVDGRPVRPARRGTGLLLPLEGADNADVPVPIEVTFVGRAKFPHRAGTVELASPRLDVPLKDARWEVFLPPDFAYSHFQGTMTYESAELLPLTQDFTQAEYQRQEISKQESFTAQALELLRRTRSEMATGNLASASKLKGFRGAPLRDKQAAAELQRLEADVKRSQSGQLIQAQNVLNFDNLNRYGLAAPDQAGRAVAPANQVDYDAKVAEQQVAQLQKAQAVAEKIVAPLRVNLPTRGLRYAFVQVLQTETDKPLVIRLRAQSERDTGWFRRLLWGVSGLVALWIAVAVIVRLRPTRASAA
jgi:type II secretory pathway pseudopilin PulG